MVQIAEPETIEATLSYFADTEAMPVTLVGAPGASDVRTGGGKPDPRQIVLRNGRPYADRFALERDGFRFVHAALNVVMGATFTSVTGWNTSSPCMCR